jgi:hypothetical protein
MPGSTARGVRRHAQGPGLPRRRREAQHDGRSRPGEEMDALVRETLKLPQDVAVGIGKMLE